MAGRRCRGRGIPRGISERRRGSSAHGDLRRLPKSSEVPATAEAGRLPVYRHGQPGASIPRNVGRRYRASDGGACSRPGRRNGAQREAVSSLPSVSRRQGGHCSRRRSGSSGGADPSEGGGGATRRPSGGLDDRDRTGAFLSVRVASRSLRSRFVPPCTYRGQTWR